MPQLALEIEYVEIAKLKPAPYNPRRALTAQERDQLSRSLTRFGAVDPAVINKDGTIIGGHQRVQVAEELGWSSFPCVRVFLSKVAEKQLNLALNKTGGDWDQEKLSELIAELLDNSKVDLEDSGFSAAELDVILAKAAARAGLGPADAVPDAPTEPESRAGDLWLLGRHRLLCGDATNPDDVAAVLGGCSPELMITDQPYGVGYDPAWRAREAKKGNLAYSARRLGEVTNDDRSDWSEAWALSPSCVAYVFHGGLHGATVQRALEESGFEVRSQIIWAKIHFPISRGHYHWRHEPCFYAVRSGAAGRWIGDRHQTTVWDDISLDANVEGGHSTQKPVECMARPMRNHLGDVYDPFVGSGTTIIAAEMQGRRCFAMEISPTYCDVAKMRWENFTGMRAEKHRKRRSSG